MKIEAIFASGHSKKCMHSIGRQKWAQFSHEVGTLHLPFTDTTTQTCASPAGVP